MTPPPLRGQLIAVVVALVVATTTVTLVAHSGASVVAGTPSRAGSSCAGQQWLTGAMRDPSAVAALRPQPVAVAAVRPPAAANKAHVVRLTAGLVSDWVTSDGSLSVVVSTVGKAAEAVTVVFPSARCGGGAASDPAASAVASARLTFEQGCGSGRKSVTHLVGSVTLDAVAMGRAELDPVTAVDQLSCRPAVASGSDVAGGSGSLR